MSAGGFGRREVAVRCFAAEYDDASLEFSESDEERAPNYVVTPTGARVNRLFVVGVLTEVEPVSDDVLRARVVDPTGAFVVYAGQYQPEAKTALDRAEPPCFVAVTGKARTFEPDDGDVVYTSIRPESITEVDAETRDRWTVQAAEQTLARVATFAAALAREERGAALTDVLVQSGVDPALASGIPRAIAHYDTKPAYLAAVRETALQAAAVVAGERDEVDPLDVAPHEGGPVDVDLAVGASIAAGVESDAPTATDRSSAAGSGAEAAASGAERSTASAGDDAVDGDAEAPTSAGAASGTDAGSTAAVDAEPVDEGTTVEDAVADSGGSADVDAEEVVADEPAAEAPADEAADAGDALGDFDAFGTDEGGAASGEPATDELYEMDEEEREAVEAEFGTEFTTGNEVDAPGEAAIETPGPDQEPASEGADAEAATEDVADDDAGEPAEEPPDEPLATDAAEVASSSGGVDEPDDAGPADDATDGAASDDAAEDEVDLVDAVVDRMGALDDGDGADREAVVEAVAADQNVGEDAVEDAIQDALMGGRCYEPGDGLLKAI